ncbi:hemolysin family protein [Fretibacter rubidus]|uniref:hemolysin family protein n=1 Tax=Fretibacter rubidus TaxID=570162 RepID=UPI00352AC2DC
MTDNTASKPTGSKTGGWLAKLLRQTDAIDPPIEDSANTKRQKKMMSAAELFHHLRVEDLMVPRADIVSVERDIGLHELSQAFEAAGHSRLPVYKETLDDPLGMVHIKDVMPFLMLNARGRNGKTYSDKKVAPGILRPVLYVPPSMLAQELMQRMQARRIHMAIVVDEYGGTDGIVTLEDLIEAIIGNIEDEHDEVMSGIKRFTTPSGTISWEADARTSIDDFEARLGRDFATVDQEDEVDTLGGLIFTLAGRIPERGEIIKHAGGIEFEVIDADARRIKRLRMRDVTKTKTVAKTAPSTTELKPAETTPMSKRKAKTKSKPKKPVDTSASDTPPNSPSKTK